MSESNYCPFCGAVNEEHSQFCGNCGATLADTPKAQPTQPPPSTDQQYGTQTYPTTPAQPVPPPTNFAQTALILSIVGIFCCICLNFASLSYLNKAKHYGENPSAINTARIVNLIAIILWIGGIIFSVISSFFWY